MSTNKLNRKSQEDLWDGIGKAEFMHEHWDEIVEKSASKGFYIITIIVKGEEYCRLGTKEEYESQHKSVA